jgi:hypothetical protein
MDLTNSAHWMWDFKVFINELEVNFSPHDPIRDAKSSLTNLTMGEDSCIVKYNVEFWKLVARLDWNKSADKVIPLSKLQICLQYALKPLSEHHQHIFAFYFAFLQLISHLCSLLKPLKLISETSDLFWTLQTSKTHIPTFGPPILTTSMIHDLVSSSPVFIFSCLPHASISPFSTLFVDHVYTCTIYLVAIGLHSSNPHPFNLSLRSLALDLVLVLVQS